MITLTLADLCAIARKERYIFQVEADPKSTSMLTDAERKLILKSRVEEFAGFFAGLGIKIETEPK